MQKIIQVSDPINNENTYTSCDAYSLVQIQYDDGNDRVIRHHKLVFSNHEFKQRANDKVRISNVKN